MTYSCGGNSTGERKEMSADGLPIFTSTPTNTSLNLIQIDFKTGNVRVTNAIRDIVTPNGKGIRRGSAAQTNKKSPPQYVLRDECEATESPQNVKDVSLEDVCMPMETRITRDSDRFESLVQYTYGDVMFENRERLDTWCGNPGRRCTDCLEISDDNWSSCADRMMAPKMVFLIRRLAALVYQTWPDDDSDTKGAGIQWLKLLEAWDEPTSSHPQGQHGNSSLHYEGRAAELTLKKSNPTKIQELARLARCAGFDHVRQENDRIKVCVLPQEGDIGEVVSLMKAQLRVVTAPPIEEHQYVIPEELDGEPRIPKLFDGWNRSQPISEHFKIQDFLCPHKQRQYFRYFRLEEKVVECLEQVITDLEEEIIVVKGYSVRSVNLINIENRHPNEKHRYQMGQAVYIALTQGSKKTVKELTLQVVRSCLPLVIFDQLSLNIGIHSDGVYIDIHPSNTSQSGTPLYMWTGSGKRKQRDIDDMDAFAYQIQRGGPIIVPRRPERACKTPTLGEDMFYVSVQLDSGRFVQYYM
ncbi:uncharacterized protein LOC106155673 [Lingula anatina]|uniref:Uncharacterized protein LOC106155673 n=1 Tax=Lingula anatina TaxID=7574 RepID=A0A1S3HKR9_LINAN|nr:uncharacterized protein LOC106155673 [Lingula anatina]|eukprot:XP_013386061.1 uncharacterized protein LOC106155673 [Lingula anatina]